MLKTKLISVVVIVKEGPKWKAEYPIFMWTNSQFRFSSFAQHTVHMSHPKAAKICRGKSCSLIPYFSTKNLIKKCVFCHPPLASVNIHTAFQYQLPVQQPPPLVDRGARRSESRALAGVQRCSGGKEGRRREVKNTRNCGCSFVSWLGIYIQNGHSQNRYSFCHVHSAHLPHPDRSSTPQASLTTRCNSLMPLTITMFLQLSPFLSTRKRTDKYRFLSLNP